MKKAYTDYINEKDLKSEYLILKGFLTKIISHCNNKEHYLITNNHCHNEFETVGDLIPWLETTNNDSNPGINSQCWDVHLIILSLCRDPFSPLIRLIFKTIPLN